VWRCNWSTKFARAVYAAASDLLGLRLQEKLVGENIAYGPKSADEVVQGWLDSPGHCENIMDPRFAEMGIAYAAGLMGLQLLLRNHRRIALDRSAHVGRIPGVHADKRQVFLFGPPRMFTRFSGLAKHHVLGDLVAIFARDFERPEVRIGLSFVARADHAHVIGILSGWNDAARSRYATNKRRGRYDSDHPLHFAHCHMGSLDRHRAR
jgi:hypothetical protein